MPRLCICRHAARPPPPPPHLSLQRQSFLAHPPMYPAYDWSVSLPAGFQRSPDFPHKSLYWLASVPGAPGVGAGLGLGLGAGLGLGLGAGTGAFLVHLQRRAGGWQRQAGLWREGGGVATLCSTARKATCVLAGHDLPPLGLPCLPPQTHSPPADPQVEPAVEAGAGAGVAAKQGAQRRHGARLLAQAQPQHDCPAATRHAAPADHAERADGHISDDVAGGAGGARRAALLHGDAALAAATLGGRRLGCRLGHRLGGHHPAAGAAVAPAFGAEAVSCAAEALQEVIERAGRCAGVAQAGRNGARTGAAARLVPGCCVHSGAATSPQAHPDAAALGGAGAGFASSQPAALDCAATKGGDGHRGGRVLLLHAHTVAHLSTNHSCSSPSYVLPLRQPRPATAAATEAPLVPAAPGAAACPACRRLPELRRPLPLSGDCAAAKGVPGAGRRRETPWSCGRLRSCVESEAASAAFQSVSCSMRAQQSNAGGCISAPPLTAGRRRPPNSRAVGRCEILNKSTQR